MTQTELYNPIKGVGEFPFRETVAGICYKENRVALFLSGKDPACKTWGVLQGGVGEGESHFLAFLREASSEAPGIVLEARTFRGHYRFLNPPREDGQKPKRITMVSVEMKELPHHADGHENVAMTFAHSVEELVEYLLRRDDGRMRKPAAIFDCVHTMARDQIIPWSPKDFVEYAGLFQGMITMDKIAA